MIQVFLPHSGTRLAHGDSFAVNGNRGCVSHFLVPLVDFGARWSWLSNVMFGAFPKVKARVRESTFLVGDLGELAFSFC